jgi:polyphosphate kinase
MRTEVRSGDEPQEPDRARAGERLRFLNRHLSWLEFDHRVLALAEDPNVPLLERVKFLAIFSTNLDEYFQVRVAEIDEQWDAGITALSPDGLTPEEQLLRIRDRVRQLTARANELFRDELRPALAENGIAIVDWEELDEGSRKGLSKQFEELILPVLTPLAVDPAHPFPYISNLSLNIGVVVRDSTTKRRRFARVKVPPFLPRFLQCDEEGRLIPVEQVIAAHLPTLFPGMEIVEHHVFRVTRNQDPDIGEDEIEDLRRAVERLVQERRRSHHAVRLEIERGTSEDLRRLLVRELDLAPWDVDEVDGLLDLGAAAALYDLPRPELKFEEWVSVVPARLAGPEADIFEAIRERDLLIQHPYDSFSATVGEFVSRAADDPSVQAIKQTLYRTSGTDSGIVASLIRAAEGGKQVVALVELTARFDEERNVTWAQELEKAGAHVVYGVVGLKTHAKVSLVVRNEADGLHRYCHVGTGNYNSTTARIYEDLGILTADEQITTDVADLFNYLTGYSAKRSYHRLLVAPYTLRSGLEELIRGQARPGGHIVMKMNGLVDTALIEALYEASQAGGEIDLIIRSSCCLLPGVAGVSERIRVRSIVGRYLEHSRIYRFGRGNDAAYYIGSGDLMPRNLDRRVEALVPIDATELHADVDRILDVYLSDRVRRWELDSSGEWRRVPERDGDDAQRLLLDLARDRAGPAPSDPPA